MLFGRQDIRSISIQYICLVIFLLLAVGIITVLTACSASEGSIVILENINGTGFTMDFNEWSSKNKCEVSLEKGDVLEVEVVREAGEIALMICGKNGSEPYTGNNLNSIAFMVTVFETDIYDVQIAGKNATGIVAVKLIDN